MLIAGLLGGCFTSTEGEPPPTDELYFPVGLALFGDALDENDEPVLGPDGNPVRPGFLVVANSDYDLHYNSGNLMVIDAHKIRALTPKPCATDLDCVDGDYPTCDTAGASASFTCVDAQGPCRGEPERSRGRFDRPRCASRGVSAVPSS